jgi:hypothetical protein
MAPGSSLALFILRSVPKWNRTVNSRGANSLRRFGMDKEAFAGPSAYGFSLNRRRNRVGWKSHSRESLVHAHFRSLNRCRLVVLVSGLLMLAGCSGGSFGGLNGGSNQTAAPVAASKKPGVKLTGSVHGGQQPIANANVYLLAANITGSGNPSLSLLTSGWGQDGNGNYYVTTGQDGSFTISGDYTCSPGQQVYLYALGGDPELGSGVNPAAGMMAVLGNCPVAGNFMGTVPYLAVNEVSTVAAAYAMAGFATDALHVSSSGTPLAQSGIANAFANAANLASLGTGTALATTPAGNGTAPQAEINTLANILAACVNSDGTVSDTPAATACYTLFTNATSDGTPSGVQPTDTATAAINIAHNPGANVASLFSLPTPTSPFLPVLGMQPNDFTVALTFTGGGLDQPSAIAIDGTGNAWIATQDFEGTGVVELSSTGAILSGASGYTTGAQAAPWAIAIDNAGNAWVANYAGNNVVELSSSGSVLSGAGGYTSNDMSAPTGIAIDATGNAWITNSAGNSVTELSNTGAVLSGTTGYTSDDLAGPSSIAIDASGNAWVADAYGVSVTEFSNAGIPLSGTSGYTNRSVLMPGGIAIDSAGDAWVANQFGFGNPATGSVNEISSTGTFLSGSSGFTSGGVTYPVNVAIDGADRTWVADMSDKIIEFSNQGVPLSGSNGYQTVSESATPFGIAIDGSGNLWFTYYADNEIVELVGVATPVVTPLAVAVQSATLGAQP